MIIEKVDVAVVDSIRLLPAAFFSVIFFDFNVSGYAARGAEPIFSHFFFF